MTNTHTAMGLPIGIMPAKDLINKQAFEAKKLANRPVQMQETGGIELTQPFGNNAPFTKTKTELPLTFVTNIDESQSILFDPASFETPAEFGPELHEIIYQITTDNKAMHFIGDKMNHILATLQSPTFVKTSRNISYIIAILSVLATRCAPTTNPNLISTPQAPLEEPLSPEQIQDLEYFKQGMELPKGAPCIGTAGEPEQTSIEGRSAEVHSETDTATGTQTKSIRIDMINMLNESNSFPEEDRKMDVLLIGAEEIRHFCESGDLVETGLTKPHPSAFQGTVLLFGDLKTDNYEVFYGLTEAISNYGAALQYKNQGSFEFFEKYHDRFDHYAVLKLFQKMVEGGLIDYETLQNEIYNSDPDMQLKGINRLTGSNALTDTTDISNVIPTQSGKQVPKITALYSIFSAAEGIDPRLSLVDKHKAIDSLYDRVKAVMEK